MGVPIVLGLTIWDSKIKKYRLRFEPVDWIKRDDAEEEILVNTANFPRLIEDYVRLGLRLGRHVDGLVDAYYGPEELSREVEEEELSEPSALVEQGDALLAGLDDGWLRDQALGLRRLVVRHLRWRFLQGRGAGRDRPRAPGSAGLRPEHPRRVGRGPLARRR